MLCALLRLQSDRTATTTLKRTAMVVVAVGVVVCRAQLTSKEADEVERVHQVYKVRLRPLLGKTMTGVCHVR